MVDARDGILLADRTDFKGESQTEIWQAFAKRGLGVTAYAPNANSTRVNASFDQPAKRAVLSFSEPSYVFGEPVRVILNDPSVTGDVALVQLTSYEVGGDVQTIRLRRNGSYFTGTVPTSSFAPALAEDGGLAVMPGSVISAYYTDVNAEGGPRQIQASVKMQPNYTRTTTPPDFRLANESPLKSGPARDW